MKHTMTYLLWFLLLGLVTGCQTTATRSPWASASTIPVGTKLHLHKPLVVPAQDNQVFIQDNREKYDSYYPFCYFELRGITDGPRTIEPDTFTINRVYRDENELVRAQPLRLASLGMIAAAGPIPIIVLSTVMDLESDKQPDVRRLVCGGGYALAPRAELPTMNNLHQVLANTATFQLPGSQTLK